MPRLMRARRVNTLLSIRGLLIGALGAYLIAGPSFHQSDVIASVMGYSLAGILLLSIIVTIVLAYRLRRRLRVQLGLPASSDQQMPGAQHGVVRSRTPARFFLQFSPLRLPPFFALTAELRFVSPSVRHKLTGSSRTERRVYEDITFPHRGDWSAESIRVQVGDQFGLVTIGWDIALPAESSTLRVYPPEIPQRELPVFSSAQRPGDMVSEHLHRLGDPYDLKQYHPSDGLKRIVWKVYAKSGNLVSRHAEPATQPEGRVLVFVLAGPDDDEACAAAIEYTRQLRIHDLEVISGCEGMDSRPLAASPEDLESLLIASTWESGRSTTRSVEKEVSQFLDLSLKLMGESSVERVLLFYPASRLREEDAEAQFLAVAAQLESRGIAPIVFLVGAEDMLAAPRAVSAPIWQQIFFEPSGTRASAMPVEETRKFLRACMNADWQAIVL